MTSDVELQQRVMDELDFEPRVNAAHIGISVRAGVVMLTGHVGSLAEKYAAERAARRVKGVTAVAQELDVHLPTDKKTGDDEIAARAVRILNWDVLIPHERIEVKVEHGTVTLSGVVEWNYQRLEAEEDVLRLGGVMAVINDILVAPRVRVDDVAAAIRGALERNAETEAHRVQVQVSGGLVTLRGKVAAWTEREAIERAAWSIPGVSHVEDLIELTRL